MPHLVTSHKGENHITSTNLAHIHAGILGEGDYVLPVLNQCSATMVDSNTLRILSGSCVCDGRQWEIEGDYEEVNIENGAPGYKREDLVVAHIETAPQEKIELRVIKGEDTTGTPVRPDHIAGDLNAGDTVKEMPICAVRVDGINPQEPVMLLEESKTIAAICDELKELRDSQSQLSSTIDATTPRLVYYANWEAEWPGEPKPSSATYGMAIMGRGTTPYAIAVEYPLAVYAGCKTSVSSKFVWRKIG